VPWMAEPITAAFLEGPDRTLRPMGDRTVSAPLATATGTVVVVVVAGTVVDGVVDGVVDAGGAEVVVVVVWPPEPQAPLATRAARTARPAGHRWAPQTGRLRRGLGGRSAMGGPYRQRARAGSGTLAPLTGAVAPHSSRGGIAASHRALL